MPCRRRSLQTAAHDARHAAVCPMEEVYALRIRVRFRKYDVMKYVGHLDLMRYFQKAIRRSRIPIRYSEGYSPHQILSFAAPLGVGLTSDGEYMELLLDSDISEIDTDELVKNLNAQMAYGVEIVSAHILPDSAKNAMASLAAAGYRVTYRDKAPFLDAAAAKKSLREFYAPGRSIIVTKKTKKSERTLDIAPLIYEFTANDDRGKIYFDMLVSAGSTENIRPELVVETFHTYLGLPFSVNDIAIHRDRKSVV